MLPCILRPHSRGFSAARPVLAKKRQDVHVQLTSVPKKTAPKGSSKSAKKPVAEEISKPVKKSVSLTTNLMLPKETKIGPKKKTKISKDINDTIISSTLFHKCPKCEFYHEQKSKIKSHLKLVHKSLPYVCTECNEGFTNFVNFKKHIQSNHKDFKIPKEPYEIIKPMKYTLNTNAIETKVNYDKMVFKNEKSDILYNSKKIVPLMELNPKDVPKHSKLIQSNPIVDKRMTSTEFPEKRKTKDFINWKGKIINKKQLYLKHSKELESKQKSEKDAKLYLEEIYKIKNDLDKKCKEDTKIKTEIKAKNEQVIAEIKAKVETKNKDEEEDTQRKEKSKDNPQIFEKDTIDTISNCYMFMFFSVSLYLLQFQINF